MKRKLEQSLANLSQALTTLESAVEIPADRELVMEGTTQRFELTIALVWKTLQRALRYQGITAVATPRASVKEAFKIGWLSDEAVWIDMLDSRNTTSHEYLAESSSQRITKISRP